MDEIERLAVLEMHIVRVIQRRTHFTTDIGGYVQRDRDMPLATLSM